MTISKVSRIVLVIKKFQSLDTVWEEIGLENKNKTPNEVTVLRLHGNGCFICCR